MELEKLLPVQPWLSENVLDPSTAPEVIRAGQRAEVRAYRRKHRRATPEQIAEALDLPILTVRWRLLELAGKPIWPEKRAAPKKRAVRDSGFAPNLKGKTDA